MRSHPIPVVVITLLIAGAPGCKKGAAPGGPDASVAEATLTAAELCDAVYGAPLRQLTARCSADEKQRKQHDYLVRLATDAKTRCMAELEPLASHGFIRPRADAVRRCGQVLESTAWKETLAIPDVTRFPECRGLIAGVQLQGQPCESTLECARDLACSRLPGYPSGTCDRPPAVGASCRRALFDALGEQRACGPGASCSSRSNNGFLSAALGAPAREPSAEPAPAGSASEPAASLTKRQRALREAEEFGMIGLLNSGGSLGLPEGRGIDDIEGRGEGIGLGSMGVSGFGSGRGRLGGDRNRKAPTVRMGATSVSGRLPPEVIQRIVRQNFGRFRLCYENGLRNDPALAGRVVVRFVIFKDGSVANVGNGGSDLPDPTVVACVIRAFHGLSFPEPEGGIVTVTYPLIFAPADGGPASARADAGAPAAADAGSAATDAGSAATDAGAALESPPSSTPTRAVEEGTCTVMVNAGESCERGEPCADGLACRLGRCSSDPIGAAGSACERGEDCQLGLYCSFTPSLDPLAARDRGVCAARKAAGAACTSSLQCEGVCASGACAALCGAR